MRTWPPSIFGHWFVAARTDLVKNKPLAVTVLDRPLVLGRLESGEIFALEDRCPHRQVPLSQGRIVPQGIQCPYHGWMFEAGGRCIAIPGLPPDECLPKVGARAIAVKELYGLLWVRLSSEGDEGPPKMLADLPIGSRRFLWQTSWGAYVVDAIENFLDPLHTHMIHPGLVRKDDARRPVRVNLSTTAEGFMLDYQGQPEQTGLLYRLFESPRTSERAHFAGAGSAQIEYKYLNGSVIRITLHFTPETTDRTHVFTTMHVENRWAPAWALRIFVWPFLKRVAQQDKRILELQTANMKRFPATRGVSTTLDIVRKNLEQIWEPEDTSEREEILNEVIVFM